MNGAPTRQDYPPTTASTLTISELSTDGMPQWDDYVRGHPGATFFHLSGWKSVLEKVFGHDTYYLTAKAGDGRLEGILPLGHLSSRLFGNALISIPFCVYGGIVASNDVARATLEAAAMELARRLNVGYLEMRNLQPQRPDWHRKELYVTFRKSIDPDPEKNMLAIPRKQRAMVRKGINAGLASELDDDIDRCFGIYADSVRRLGTPVFPKKLFRELKDVFGRDCEVLTVTKQGRAVCSVMSFYFRDQVLPYYGGGTRDARSVAGNDFMYWELMRRACERGVKFFDYGRSKKGTGSYSFKKNWGFEPEPLHYETLLVNARELPDINPLNPKYRLFINLWKRLPLPVTKIIGPMIARNLG